MIPVPFLSHLRPSVFTHTALTRTHTCCPLQDGSKKVNRSLCLFGDGRVRDFFVSSSNQVTFFFHQAIALEGLTHVLLKFDGESAQLGVEVLTEAWQASCA